MSSPTYPLIEFTLSIGTWETADYAYPDTGFEGGILIPAGAGREVLAQPAPTPWRLADGRVIAADSWSGVVTLDGRAFRAEAVAIGNRYLIGRESLDQLEICFEFGKRVNLRLRDTTP